MLSRAGDGAHIVAFYAGDDTDDRGRRLADVLMFDDAALERTHDFIQWLFPLRERSGANPRAPRLDDAAIEAFRIRPELRAALRRSLERMLAFYGLQWQGDAIVPSSAFAERSGWLTAENHNHLRLTRILKSLVLLGEPGAAAALFNCLSVIEAQETQSGRTRITSRSFRFWREAVQPE